MSKYSQARDVRVADDSVADRALMCCANGCPNRWTVDAGNGRCCSAHQWAGPERWPEITQQQQWDEVERARNPVLPVAVTHLSAAEKRAILEKLRKTAASFRTTAEEWS